MRNSAPTTFGRETNTHKIMKIRATIIGNLALLGVVAAFSGPGSVINGLTEAKGVLPTPQATTGEHGTPVTIAPATCRTRAWC